MSCDGRKTSQGQTCPEVHRKILTQSATGEQKDPAGFPAGLHKSCEATETPKKIPKKVPNAGKPRATYDSKGERELKYVAQ